jgi:hypothetical protein
VGQSIEGVNILTQLQGRFCAQDSWPLLAIFQAMNAVGKRNPSST